MLSIKLKYQRVSQACLRHVVTLVKPMNIDLRLPISTTWPFTPPPVITSNYWKTGVHEV